MLCCLFPTHRCPVLQAALREMVCPEQGWAQGWGRAHLEEVLPPALSMVSFCLLPCSRLSKGSIRRWCYICREGRRSPLSHLAPTSLSDTSPQYGGVRLTDPVTCPSPLLAAVGLEQPPQRLGTLQVSEKSRLARLRAPMLRLPAAAAVSHWPLSAVSIFPRERKAGMMVY